jgi:hypothetical protein
MGSGGPPEPQGDQQPAQPGDSGGMYL